MRLRIELLLQEVSYIKTFHALAALVCFLCIVPMVDAASRIDLNGEWQFRLDATKQGEQLGWTKRVPDATGADDNNIMDVLSFVLRSTQLTI